MFPNNESANQANNPCDFADLLDQTVLNSLSAHIAILDADGVILATNDAWRRFAHGNAVSGTTDSVGQNYLAICDAATGLEARDAHAVAKGIRAVINGEVSEFLYDYPCHAPDGEHWYYMRAIQMVGSGPLRVVTSHEEITALKLTERALVKKGQQLRQQKEELAEANTALKVLLRQREKDQDEIEQTVIANVKERVLPVVGMLQNARIPYREKQLLELVENHLQQIVSPFLNRMKAANLLLTPQEIQVADLVRDGKSSKEIAQILYVSEATVHFHRKNLRNKLGLKGQPTNLRTFLMSQQ